MSTTDNPSPEDEPLQFPLVFPLKVMGRNEAGFVDHICTLLHPQLGDVADSSIERAESRNGRFVSLTITFTATSREQLDTIYKSVTADPSVLYTL